MKPAKPKVKTYKPKKCALCSITFTPTRNLQKVCGPRCAIDYNRIKEAKAAEAKKESKLKIRRLDVKPPSYFASKAQQAFNAYIRERDADAPCISCDRFHEGQYHAGHFRTVGAHKNLRFDEDNCHKQCSVCNNFHSGNISKYRPNLIKKIGQERFDRLMGDHKPKHYSRHDYEEIATEYRRKTRELKKQRAA